MWYTETGPPVGSHLKSKHAGSRVQTAHLGITVCVAVRLLLQLLPLLAFLFLLFQLPFHLGCNVRSLGFKKKQNQVLTLLLQLSTCPTMLRLHQAH